MTIATAIFLIAIGAILRYAINVHSDVINIQTVGLILMIAVSALAFAAAGVALAANAIAPEPWLMPAFTSAIATGVGAQVWFIVVSLKSMKA